MNRTRRTGTPHCRTTPLVCGALRLHRNADGVLTKGEFLRDGVRYGPVLTTQPAQRTGTFRGAGLDESYSDSIRWQNSSWSGITYDRWIRLCGKRLEHLAIECRWREANCALAGQRWEEATAAYAQVAAGWSGYWLGLGHDDAKRLTLERQIIATLVTHCTGKVPAASAKLLAHLAHYVDLCDDQRTGPFLPLLDCLDVLLTAAEKERVLHDAVSRRLAQLMKIEAARTVNDQAHAHTTGDTPSQLAHGITERWKALTACVELAKFPVKAAFLAALAEHAAEHTEIARLHAWYTSQEGRYAESGAAHIELAQQSDARMEDLNNATLAHLTNNRFTAAQALLTQAEQLQSQRGWIVLPSRDQQLLMDEYFFQHHLATLRWMQKSFPDALVAAERCLQLENQLIDNARIEDPFSGKKRLRTGGFTAAGVWAVITALTALKRYADGYAHVRAFLGDARLMTVRLESNRLSTEWAMLAAWCLYEEAATAGATAEQDWAETFALMRKRLPDPRHERISHAYACFAARLGLPKVALKYVRTAITQGTPLAELRNSTSLKALATDRRFTELLRS
ncbi:MAG TPA: hypothetical protein VHX44_12580 [Planctomycetota bacterium]|nr:hypothetical protein [Planctomycetota bacterium]